MKLQREEILGIAGVLVHTMGLDCHDTDDELVFIDNFLERIGVEPNDRAEVVRWARQKGSTEEHAELVKSRKARIYALQQALLLALSDGEYQGEERQGLRRLAERFSIDEVLFEDLEKWAIQGATWQIKGAALLAR